jgi:hypothetical protein
MNPEHVDRRIVAALRFVDAVTGLPVRRPLRVAANGVKWSRNRSGSYLITEAPGFEDYIATFAEPPAEPEPSSEEIELTVHDPENRFLARRRTVRLPRDPDPGHAAEPDSLFQALVVPLFRSPSADLSSGWAVIRATVHGDEAEERLGGALIRVLRGSDGEHLGSGLSDARGEALVAIPGIPVTPWEDEFGTGQSAEVEVRLDVVHDPEDRGVPDPDDLEARREELVVRSRTATLASGRVLTLAL